MYIPTGPVFQGGINALTVNTVNLQGVNLTLHVNHYNRKKGEFDFIETTYVFPIMHMVAPKDQSLSCTVCHSKTDSRLANLQGFYMSGRDGSKVLN